MPHRLTSIMVVLVGTMLVWCGCTAGFVSRNAEVTREAPKDHTSPHTVRTIVDPSPHPRLDGWENALEWLPRHLPWGKKPHQDDSISPSTVAMLERYLKDHNLTDIEIVIDEYDVEARRARRVRSAIASRGLAMFGEPLLWREAVFPARVFDRNEYDPVGNVIYVNSDQPAELLVQAATAVRLNGARNRSLALIGHRLPVVSSLGRMQAMSDAIAYARREDLWELEQEGHHMFYRESLGGLAFAGAPFVPWYVLPVGHFVGTWVGDQMANDVIRNRTEQRAALLDATTGGRVRVSLDEVDIAETVMKD